MPFGIVQPIAGTYSPAAFGEYINGVLLVGLSKEGAVVERPEQKSAAFMAGVDGSAVRVVYPIVNTIVRINTLYGSLADTTLGAFWSVDKLTGKGCFVYARADALNPQNSFSASQAHVVSPPAKGYNSEGQQTQEWVIEVLNPNWDAAFTPIVPTPLG